MTFKSCWSRLKLARFTEKTTDLRENRTFLYKYNAEILRHKTSSTQISENSSKNSYKEKKRRVPDETPCRNIIHLYFLPWIKSYMYLLAAW
jgi:hypothetical protein